jgi:hypothetical protein
LSCGTAWLLLLAAAAPVPAPAGFASAAAAALIEHCAAAGFVDVAAVAVLSCLLAQLLLLRHLLAQTPGDLKLQNSGELLLGALELSAALDPCWLRQQDPCLAEALLWYPAQLSVWQAASRMC